MSEAFERYLAGEAATEKLGAQLAAALPARGVIYLYGDLGAGKTTLVRGLMRALGYEKAVRSPTYTLMEPYELEGHALYHLDLYRLGDAEELEYLGLRDVLAEDYILLVEWPQRGLGALPAADLEVELEYADQARWVRLHARTALGASLCAALSEPDKS